MRLLQNRPKAHYNCHKMVKEAVKRCVSSCFLKVLRSVRLRIDEGREFMLLRVLCASSKAQIQESMLQRQACQLTTTYIDKRWGRWCRVLGPDRRTVYTPRSDGPLCCVDNRRRLRRWHDPWPRTRRDQSGTASHGRYTGILTSCKTCTRN